MASARRLTPAALAALDRTEFVDFLGAVFEHSPWVAEVAWQSRPFASLAALHQAMTQAMRAAAPERQLALLRAHPELASKAALAGDLTRESAVEQASAGLDRCTLEELANLREGNQAYQEKFGFPFIMAVKGKSKREILDALSERLRHTRELEFSQALDEVANIARFRLADLVES
ncbi:MAG: 2-oxo-4-hydroxy-4-carboxy-5-ureidoimidazoline decarboxylase [Gammaproteobacteria bacterium]